MVQRLAKQGLTKALDVPCPRIGSTKRLIGRLIHLKLALGPLVLKLLQEALGLLGIPHVQLAYH